MLNFTPRDSLSKELLKSIPKKHYMWLANIGYPLYGNGECDGLTWSYDTDISWIKIHSSGIVISWTGAPDNPKWIAGSDSRFENIIDNIAFFVSVEKSIYDELEKLQILRDQLNSTPEPEVDRPVE